MISFKPSGKPIILAGIGWLILAVLLFGAQLLIKPSVEIKWATETEFNTAGFNILRSESEDGNYIQVNQHLITSKADPSTGAAYSFTDKNVQKGRVYYYRLQDIEYDNSTTLHEPIQVRAQNIIGWYLILSICSGAVGLAIISIAIFNLKKS